MHDSNNHSHGVHQWATKVEPIPGHSEHTKQPLTDAQHVHHAGHDMHAGHSVAMFRKKFWVSLALTIPTLLWGYMLQRAFEYTVPHFPASRWIQPVFGCIVFAYGGWVFIQDALRELRDREKAQHCFVAGLEDSVKATNVFREWAHTWARRAIIRNAICELRPQATNAGSSVPASVVSQEDKLRIIRDGHLAIDSVLALEDFERVVFVITVLERYSDQDCALPIGCSIEEIRAARICALKEIANLARADSSCEVAVGCGPHQLPLVTNVSLLARRTSEFG